MEEEICELVKEDLEKMLAVRPTVTYACEACKLNTREGDTLDIWDRSLIPTNYNCNLYLFVVVLKIYNKVKKDHWRKNRRRTNQELRCVYSKPLVSQLIYKVDGYDGWDTCQGSKKTDREVSPNK